MKKLVALISTKGKTSEQISKETMTAHKKYQQTKKQQEKIHNKEILTAVYELNELVKTLSEKQNSQHVEIMLALRAIQTKDEAKGKVFEETETDEEIYARAKEFVIKEQRASTSYLQRKFGIGYARASRLIDLLEEGGVIGPAKGSKPRKVSISKKDKK